MNQHDLYVYYKVARAKMAHHHLALQRLAERIHRDYSVECKVRYRPGEGTAHVAEDTWMEIWENIPPGFQQLLLPLSADTGASACIIGQRHFELFQTLPAPDTVAHSSGTAPYMPPQLQGATPSSFTPPLPCDPFLNP